MSNAAPDIVAVIDSYSPLEHKGSLYRGYCPFCHGADDKLIVRPDIQTWHCFECGVGGDVYDFVAMYAHVSRAQAARLLAMQEDQSAPLSVEQDEESPASAPAPAATATPTASPAAEIAVAAEEPVSTAWAEPEVSPYHDYFQRLRRLKGYRLAAILDSEHLLAVDNPSGEDPPLGELGDDLTEAARKADSLFGGGMLGESYEVLFEGETDALIFLAFHREGQALRVLVLLQDKTQIYLARMQAASLRKTG